MVDAELGTLDHPDVGEFGARADHQRVDAAPQVAALFLASDGARFITGTALDADSGYHIT